MLHPLMTKTHLFHHLQQGLQMMFMVLLMTAMGCSLTACSDDDDNGGGGGNGGITFSKDSETAMSLLSILSPLADVTELPDNWNSNAYTVEPTIGKVLDEANSFVRSEAVNSIEEAVAKYNNLTDADIDTTVTSHTWKNDSLGCTLTYHKGTEKNVVATIDVNVKQLPHLTQLRLVTPESIGLNASYTSYYRMGDVVRKNNCYWICVRSAHDKSGKDHTHWCSFQLEPRNYKYYAPNESNDETIVPTELGKDVEKMGYLMQLLCVLAKPERYTEYINGEVIKRGLGLGGLKYAAHPIDVVNKIAEIWDREGIWKKAVPVEKEFFNPATEVNVFYYGYSRPTSWFDMRLYRRTFSGSAFRRSRENTLKWTMDTNHKEFDIRDYVYGGNAELKNAIDKNRGIVVRYADGKTLDDRGEHPAPDEAIQGVEEIYRYNKYIVSDHDDIATDYNTTGTSYYRPGDVVESKVTGMKYICIEPAADSIDHSPYSVFISFDESRMTIHEGYQFDNIIKERDVPRITYQLAALLHDPQTKTAFWNSLQSGLHLNGNDFFISRKDGDKIYHCATIGCNDEDNRTGLMRMVFAEENTSCEFWKKYEDGVHIKWSDVYNQSNVDKYAKDHYTLLPYTLDNGRSPYRTFAEGEDLKLEDYLFDVTTNKFKKPNLYSMFNDRILLFTILLKVDKGQEHPDLKMIQRSDMSNVVAHKVVNRYLGKKLKADSNGKYAINMDDIGWDKANSFFTK